MAHLGGHLAVQLVDQRRGVPRRGTNEGLERLSVKVVSVGNGLGVLVLEVGEQPSEVGPGGPPALGAGERGDEGLGEGFQAADGAAEGRRRNLAIGEQLILALLKPGLHRLTPSIEVVSPLEGIDTNALNVRSSDPRQ